MKKLSSVVAIVGCCFASLLALTGCDALGLTITDQGIQGNSNTLMLLVIVFIVLFVVVQRLLDR